MPLRKYGRRRWSGPKIAAAVIGGAFFMVFFAAAFGFVVQYLWNWIMPGIFNLREITYGEAFGIMILARLLVGGFGGRGGGGHSNKWRRHRHHEKDWCEDWEHYEEWWDAEGRESLKKFSEARQKKNPEETEE